MINAVFITIGLFIFINYIKIILRSNKPVKTAATSMFTGGFALLAVSAASFLLVGTQVAVNLYTTFIALTLGIPGVILIVLKLFVI